MDSGYGCDNAHHLETCEGCLRCDWLLDFYMACDDCGSWGNKDADGWNRTEDGRFLCNGCFERAAHQPKGEKT